MGVNEVAGRWRRASRHMREEDADLAETVVMFAKQFSSETFYAFDDPLEAALFSVVISMVREQERAATREPDETTSPPLKMIPGSPDERQSEGPGTGFGGAGYVDH